MAHKLYAILDDNNIVIDNVIGFLAITILSLINPTHPGLITSLQDYGKLL